MVKPFAIGLVLALTLVSTAFAQLTPEQQAADDKGVVLYSKAIGTTLNPVAGCVMA